MLIKKPDDIKSSEITDKQLYLNRRKFILAASALGVTAAGGEPVPPLAAQGLMHAVSSQDKEYIEVRGGHISVFSGRQAHAVMWPKLDAWVTERSTGLPAATALHTA